MIILYIVLPSSCHWNFRPVRETDAVYFNSVYPAAVEKHHFSIKSSRVIRHEQRPSISQNQLLLPRWEINYQIEIKIDLFFNHTQHRDGSGASPRNLEESQRIPTHWNDIHNPLISEQFQLTSLAPPTTSFQARTLMLPLLRCHIYIKGNYPFTPQSALSSRAVRTLDESRRFLPWNSQQVST